MRPEIKEWGKDVAVVLLLPIVLPCIAIDACVDGLIDTCNAAVDATRPLRRSISKQKARHDRRKFNKRADANDVASTSISEATRWNANHCHLLRLPPELRLQIYELCFEASMVTIEEVRVHKAGYKVVGNGGPEYSYYRRGLSSYSSYKNRRYALKKVAPFLPDAVGLPFTCRYIHNETIEYLYTTNTFRFESHDQSFLLPRLQIFPQKYLDRIRSLELRFCVDELMADLRSAESLNCSDGHKKRTRIPLPLGPQGPSKRCKQWIALWTLLPSLPQLRSLRVEFTRYHPFHHYTRVPVEAWMIEWLAAPMVKFESESSLEASSVGWLGDLESWRSTSDTYHSSFFVNWCNAPATVQSD